MSNSLDARGDGLKTRRTPLPIAQLSILLLLRFTESASTFVIFPFLNELLSSVTGGDGARVGYYAGIMESIRQLLSLVSVMYWSRLSDQIGRKPILLLGTLALAVATTSFGLSKTFWGLVVSRCIFTALNSNAGVIKSMVGEITDHSNSADAFALLHVPWAVGSSFGAFTGGWLARPRDHFPDVFPGHFWVEYPYLLPCGIMASFAIFASCLVFVFLKEVCSSPLFLDLQLAQKSMQTVPEGIFYMRRQRDGELEPLLCPSDSQPTRTLNSEPVPLRSLLQWKTLIPLLNYVSIASLHASSNAIQPLFLAMPVTIGGLALPPREIGIILGTYGITNSIFQTVMLGRLVRRFGVKTVFMAAIAAFIPIFAFSPLMNLLVSEEGFSYVVWIMLGCQLSCSLVMELGYGALHFFHMLQGFTILALLLPYADDAHCLETGCVYMFITAAAPNKGSLGATNGLGQTFVSIGRIVTPVMASSLLSLSIERHVLWGYAAYVVLIFVTVGSIGLASRLPRRLD
ncbi:hypothetical protein CVT25_008340 [Psilocybe cyanescens]|uniref:Major facilitator superfamily (MFS) profile domain-containing protein n=1 Tax=Psilocybe cyanescens TaxID=93625 RepID=A0A409WV78_PSICY|nr:hypothetical protein CVT25_008340 [Psilocybe cyanescens]